MEARRLRRLDRLVPRLGLGLAALGRPGYINLGHALDLDRDYDPLSMQRRAHGVLDAASGMRVGWLDAARSYGEGERFLGSWLAIRGFAPGTFTVASKWGYAYTAGWQVRAERHEIKDHTLPLLRRQLEESRGNLGEHLAVYQIHSATLESGVLDDSSVLAELSSLRQAGLRIGLSVSGTGQAATIRKAMAVEIDGVPLFDTVQATWNLLERSAGDALSEAHASGMGVIVKEGLANGRLAGRGEAIPELEREAARLGATLDALSLAAVLAQPWADVVLSGAATVEQLKSNAAAFAVSWDAQAEAALAAMAEPTETYWLKRAGMAWN